MALFYEPGPASNRSPITRLPFELLTTIFSDLKSQAELGTLRHCTLVCRMWAELCRKYTFSDLAIDTTEVQRVLEFQELVQVRESIKTDVRTLGYSMGINPSDKEEDIMYSSFQSNPHSHLVLVLNLLAHQSVESFTLDFFDSRHEDSDKQQPWRMIPSFFIVSVDEFIGTNPLTRLTLMHIRDIPAAYLTPQAWLRPELRILKLEGVCIHDVAFHETDRHESAVEQIAFEQLMSECIALPNDTRNAPKLKSFEAIWCDLDGWISMLTRYWAQEEQNDRPLVLDFSELQELVIAQDEQGSVMSLLTYALKVTQCLHFLYLEGYNDTFDYTGLLTPNLSSHSLRTLRLIEIRPIICELTDDPYLDFAEELHSLKSLYAHTTPPLQLGLETLYINIRNMTNGLFNTRLAPWSRLDEVLLGSPDSEVVFGNLRRLQMGVELNFMPGYQPHGLKQKLQRIGEQAFPRLMASNKVDFDFRVWEGPS